MMVQSRVCDRPAAPVGATTGRVFDIQRFCIHDGPGVRTVVFVAGCPLRCVWCHNPEGFDAASARLWTAAAVVDAVVRDRPFYAGEGGLTLSGGEPLANFPFAWEVLSLARRAGLNTCVQSSGFVPRDHFDTVCAAADHLYVDLKHMDSEVHLALTGVPNERILDNITRALARDGPLEVRYPLIPGLNDGGENLAAMSTFLLGRGCTSLRIVPYRNYYLGKPEAVRRGTMPVLAESCSTDQLERARDALARHGISTEVDA